MSGWTTTKTRPQLTASSRYSVINCCIQAKSKEASFPFILFTEILSVFHEITSVLLDGLKSQKQLELSLLSRCWCSDLSLSLSPVSGLCGVSIREALPAAFHLPEEEPQEEADGLLLFLHVCEIPLWTAQLHRPARHGHPRKFSRRSLHESYLNIQVVKKTEPLKVKVLWLYLWKISWLMLEANGFSFVLFYPLIFEGWRWADVDLQLQLFWAFLCFVSFRRANKSRPNVPPPSSSSATLTPASCCAQTWQLEGWTSPRWTGSCSTTLQMTPRSISFWGFFYCICSISLSC